MRLPTVCVVVGLASLGCATPRPVLYPNAELERAGREQAQRDVDACLARADEDVGRSGERRSGGPIAARTVTRSC